ncbi:MAG: hypothetical protein CUN56_09160 [Phototrophicales bacterium]|nr:MAG: hypothetical protein CUN56_09160 [Phototrophicales bacterium]
MLNFTVIGLTVASKLLIDVVNDGGYFNPSAILEPTDFAVLPMNVGIFVLPLIMAGMLRSVKGKPTKAIYPSMLMGLLGGAYFFLFWSIEQNDPDQIPQPGDDMQQGMLFIAVVVALPYLQYRWQQFKNWWKR